MKERIDRIIDRRANDLLQKAADGEPVSAAEFESLKRLVALDELAAGARGKRVRTWPIAAAALVTLALVSSLLFSRVSSTDVELEAKLSELTFTVASRQAILGTQDLMAMGAVGLENVRLPATDDAAQRELSAAADELCNTQVEMAGPASAGSLSLTGFSVPEGTKISLTYTAADQVTLTLIPPTSQRLTLAVSVRGAVRTTARCAGVLVNEQTDYRSPQLIELAGASSAPLTIQFTLARDASMAFSSQIDVADISMFQVDQLIEGTSPLARRVSSLVSGVLYLEALNGKQVALRPYEELRFARSAGVIRKLSLSSPSASDAGAIAVHVQASVQGMTIGNRRNERSLMPTYLEWLSARQGLALLWGSTLYVTGVLASLLRWLEISR